MPIAGVAVAWMREEDWPRWLAIDPDFQPDYGKWLAKTEAAFKSFEAQGHKLEKIVLDPDDFLAWSREFAGGEVNSNARSKYAALMLHGRTEGRRRGN